MCKGQTLYIKYGVIKGVKGDEAALFVHLSLGSVCFHAVGFVLKVAVWLLQLQ